MYVSLEYLTSIILGNNFKRYIHYTCISDMSICLSLAFVQLTVIILFSSRDRNSGGAAQLACDSLARAAARTEKGDCIYIYEYKNPIIDFNYPRYSTGNLCERNFYIYIHAVYMTQLFFPLCYTLRRCVPRDRVYVMVE